MRDVSIRPSWAEPGNQKRFLTPHQALEAGTHYVGIGWPAAEHRNPPEAVAQILSELKDGTERASA